MPTLKVLAPGDEPALEAFLVRHADSSLLLRSNARQAGLVDRGKHLQGTYVAALESGQIVGVAAHCWNGMVLLQAPPPAPVGDVARAAVEKSGRPVNGLMGPLDQVTAARRALGLEGVRAAKDDREVLFGLNLADLILPGALAEGHVTCRRPGTRELDLIARWRVAFALEALGRSDTPALRTEARDHAERHQGDGSHWLAFSGERPVAYAAFTGTLPDMVQVGGVWTPPALRGRAYAQAVVAGALQDARVAGIRRSILFTPVNNIPAQRAYEAIGFQRMGDYGLVLLPQ
jgi:ribosomal protein S18 acetylase RimI-like enzyme